MSNATIKTIIISTILILVIASIILWGIIPASLSLLSNKNEFIETERELMLARNKYSSLNDLSNRQEEISQTKETIFEYIPESSSTSNFVVKIEALANELSISQNIPSFSVTEIKSTKNISQKSDDNQNPQQSKTPSDSTEFSLNFTSSYSTIQTFIIKMKSFPRYNSISTLSVTDYNPEIDQMDIALTGKIYHGK